MSRLIQVACTRRCVVKHNILILLQHPFPLPADRENFPHLEEHVWISKILLAGCPEILRYLFRVSALKKAVRLQLKLTDRYSSLASLCCIQKGLFSKRLSAITQWIYGPQNDEACIRRSLSPVAFHPLQSSCQLFCTRMLLISHNSFLLCLLSPETSSDPSFNLKLPR